MFAMAIGGLFVVHGRFLRREIERLRRVGRRTSAVVVDYGNLVGVIGWIMIVGPAIAAVTVLVIFRDALTTAPSEVASASQNDVTFDKLRTGDCIDPAPPEFDIISTLPVVPCTQLHDGQVLGTRYLGEDEWPGDDAIYDRSDKECSIQFEAFVGIPVDDSRFDLSWYSPDQESWQGGDHLVACVVSDPRGQTVGTLRAARR